MSPRQAARAWWTEWRRLAGWYPARDPFLILPAVVWLLVTTDWQAALCLPILGGLLRMHKQTNAGRAQR